MTLSQELSWRGFVNQTTFADVSELDAEIRTFYFGVDPSAPSMTIGNLAAAMMVRHFITHGHKALLLVGGATGMIGDPDGKKQERDLRTLDEVNSDKKAIAAQYKIVFNGMDFTVVDNYDWFKDINYLEFLRDVGKHVSITQMLDRDFVQSRTGKDGAGLNYAEFSYSLIQGYDFLHLFRTHGATLQLSGADQWGNMIAGVDLISRIENGKAHVWTSPLVVNKSTGVKFGKSEDGAVWLASELTSVFDFYQFWLNLDDSGVGDYIKMYTLISPEEFDELMNDFKSNPASRTAQKYLAHAVTEIIHGNAQADAAQASSGVLFSGDDVASLDSSAIELLTKQIPTISVAELIPALVESELASSNSEARRLIEAGAVSVNGEKISNADYELSTNPSLLKRGKNKFALYVG